MGAGQTTCVTQNLMRVTTDLSIVPRLVEYNVTELIINCLADQVKTLWVLI